MRRRIAIAGLVAAGLIAAAAPSRAADQQTRFFLGSTFAGSSTYVDLSGDDAPSKAHLTYGGNLDLLGEIVGVDVDFAYTPGLFEGKNTNLVLKSSVTTLTGNVVVGMPRRWSEYSLRLYFVGGGGIMRVREEDIQLIYDISKVVPAVDLGVGAVGFLTNRVGVAWELRRFQQVGDTSQQTGLSFGGEHLSFWRAHMALVIRY
ncbi:MAG TPA: outer membrane beta-barrel protein [Vicinamibacterales bacterium]|nr:outer membrane beta-barrel protein [Vicinamibacterales bacterium]